MKNLSLVSECHFETKPKNLLLVYAKSRCFADAQHDIGGVQRDCVFILCGRAQDHESLRGEIEVSGLC